MEAVPNDLRHYHHARPSVYRASSATTLCLSSQRASGPALAEYKARNSWPHKLRAAEPSPGLKSHPSCSHEIFSFLQIEMLSQGGLKATHEAETSKYQISPSSPENGGYSVHEGRILGHSNFINDCNSCPVFSRASVTPPAWGMESDDSLRKPQGSPKAILLRLSVTLPRPLCPTQKRSPSNGSQEAAYLWENQGSLSPCGLVPKQARADRFPMSLPPAPSCPVP